MPFTLAPADRPTMYFVGVTTGHSSIHAVFPQWARRLGLGDCALRGLDLPLRAPAEDYRRIVEFIRGDPRALGALVTTHKLDLFRACREQFDEIEPVANTLGEVSSIYKRGGRLHGRSVDPWTVGYALASFVPAAAWRRDAQVLILGAGGSGTALAWHLGHAAPGEIRPRRIVVADRERSRLDPVRRLQASWDQSIPVECQLVAQPEDADELVRRLPAGSLIVNATGAGKDTPGSPLTDAVVFPENGFAWDFNYRGELKFLEQARAQQSSRGLRVEDGWVYFVHGWTQVIADVFDRGIPTHGPLFDELGGIAAKYRV